MEVFGFVDFDIPGLLAPFRTPGGDTFSETQDYVFVLSVIGGKQIGLGDVIHDHGLSWLDNCMRLDIHPKMLNEY